MKVRAHKQRILDAVQEPGLRISENMLLALADAGGPTEVLFYLRAYPEIAAKISEMNPERARHEIEKIDCAWEELNAKLGDALASAHSAACNFKNYESYLLAMVARRAKLGA